MAQAFCYVQIEYMRGCGFGRRAPAPRPVVCRASREQRLASSRSDAAAVSKEVPPARCAAAFVELVFSLLQRRPAADLTVVAAF